VIDGEVSIYTNDPIKPSLPSLPAKQRKNHYHVDVLPFSYQGPAGSKNSVRCVWGKRSDPVILEELRIRPKWTQPRSRVVWNDRQD
jgi:hypothetical protein